MTDEELSELAELLQHECNCRISEGYRVVPWPERRGSGLECCPIGAAFSVPRGLAPFDWVNNPLPTDVAQEIQRGFDGFGPVGVDNRAFALGRLFREQYK